MQQPYPVRFAVADVDHAASVDQDAVRTREAARQGVAGRSVAALAGAGDGLDDACFQVDTADGVTLGVGDVEAAIRRIGDSFGTGEFRQPGGSAVSRVTLFARAGNVVNAMILHIDPVDSVAFPQHQVNVSLRIYRERARPIQRCAGKRRSVRSGCGFTCAGERADRSSREIYPSNAAVPNIADKQRAIARESDAVRLAQLRLGGGTAIAAESGLAGACNVVMMRVRASTRRTT